MKEYWQITYYGYGMTPQRRTYSFEEAARSEWERMKDDPHAGASRLEKITILEQK